MQLPGSRNYAIAAPLLSRLARVHDNHKRVAGSALLIGMLTLVAKLFVAGREVAIAWRYGVSRTVDAYQLSLTIVTWVPMLLTGVMGIVLVPLLVRVHRQRGHRDGFVSELNGAVLLTAVAVGVATYIAAPAAARLLASSLDPGTLRMTSTFARDIAPVASLMIVAGYFTARLQSRERFGYTAAEAVPAAAIAIFVLSRFSLAYAVPLIVGTLIGYLAQLIVLAMLVVHGDPPLGTVAVRHRSDQWRAIYGSFLIMGLGQLLITAVNPVDQAFAARLGEGAVATLGYANRIIMLFTGLATVVIGRALLPVLSGAVADGELNLGRRQTIQWSLVLVGVAAAGSLLLWIAAPEFVRLLFQRGAFGEAATKEVSTALRFGGLQLPFYFGGIALVQWIAAKGFYSSLLWIAFGALVTKLLLNALLVTHFGLAGLMSATAAMYAFSFACQYVVAVKK